MNSPQQAIIVFAREPQQGRVKTRMLKSLQAVFVTDLYKTFIEDVLEQVTAVEPADKFLYYAHDRDEVPFLNQFADRLTIRAQQGQTLGDRMHHAFSEVAAQGYKRAVIIGTDCIEISRQDLADALETLTTAQCCLGPSTDGGYYLIGLQQSHPAIFEGVEWGTETVFDTSVANIRRLGLSLTILPTKEDMDTIESLKSFGERMDRVDIARRTRRILKDKFINLPG